MKKFLKRQFVLVIASLVGLLTWKQGLSQSANHPGEEFSGPFASWITVNSGGDSITDATSIIQAAIETAGNLTGPKCVVYLPAGVYRITNTLRIDGKMAISIIGENPSNTRIIWGGAQGGTMISLNGTAYSRINRLTIDGKSVARVGVDQSWDNNNSTGHFDTGNEYADDVFTGLIVCMRGGMQGYGFAETSVLRCKFIRPAIGIELGNFNALDLWVWNSTFEECYYGITNIYGAGNFKVYNSLFKYSGAADIQIQHTGYGEFSFRGNTSIGSKSFFVTSFTQNPGATVIQGNTILDPTGLAVAIRNQGAVSIIDNIFRTANGYNGPVVEHVSAPTADFFAMGNVYTSSSPYTLGARYGIFDKPTVSFASLANIGLPVQLSTPATITRTVFEIPSNANAATFQSIINQAVQAGNKAIVHIPKGEYWFNQTVVIPPSDIQIIGDGSSDRHCSKLGWSGANGGILLKVEGPSKVVLRDFAINGNARAENIVFTNVDQPNSKLFFNQVEINNNQYNLYEANVANTNLFFRSSRFSQGLDKSINITNSSNGTVIMGGLEWGNNVGTYVDGNARLLIRDVWDEGHTTGQYMHIAGNPNVIVEGGHVFTHTSSSVPQFRISNFSGKLSLNANYVSNPVQFTGTNTGKFLGIDINSFVGDFITTGGNNMRRLFSRGIDPNNNISGSGSFSTPNLGTVDSNYIADMLSYSRSVNGPDFSDNGAGATDVRVFRIWSYNAAKGISVEGSAQVLPLSFISFSSNCNAQAVDLSWTTASAKSTKSFKVENSFDGTNWKQVDAISVDGNGTGTNKYNYTHKNAVRGNYYRIVAYDYDGKMTVSNIIKTSCSMAIRNVEVFPNPIKNDFTVSIYSADVQNISLKIFDGKGALIKKIDTKTEKGQNQYNVNVQELSAGTYYLRTELDGKVETVNLVKAK